VPQRDSNPRFHPEPQTTPFGGNSQSSRKPRASTPTCCSRSRSRRRCRWSA